MAGLRKWRQLGTLAANLERQAIELERVVAFSFDRDLRRRPRD